MIPDCQRCRLPVTDEDLDAERWEHDGAIYHMQCARRLDPPLALAMRRRIEPPWTGHPRHTTRTVRRWRPRVLRV